jgi:hypothetical protein
MWSSDSETELTGKQFMDLYASEYLSSPSPHDQDGGSDVDMDEGPSSPPPILNKAAPDDFAGAPVKKDEYMKVPLSAQYKKLIRIYIKRAGFIRQKVRKLIFLTLLIYCRLFLAMELARSPFPGNQTMCFFCGHCLVRSKKP